MTLSWVIGAGGLLGTALSRALRQAGSTWLFVPQQRFSWHDGPALKGQLLSTLHTFSTQLRPQQSWEIYWAAGVGTMSSAPQVLRQETCALDVLLQAISTSPRLLAGQGAVALASSAGAVYAGSAASIITEKTAPAPTTAYAREKLLQETLLYRFACANDPIRAQVARISTLYGSGKAPGKQQGLLTHIARSIVHKQPVQIYVPYDTIRDYIAADDAAAAMVIMLRGVTTDHHHVTKIIASEKPVTIAEIIAIFNRVSRRRPRVVTSASALSSLYAQRIQFRSVVLDTDPAVPARSLPIGIAQLMDAERHAFARTPALAR